MPAEMEILESELAELLLRSGYHLLELKAGGDDVLRLIVHREPGITHEDCAAIARIVQGWSGTRGGEDILERYMLEVSSPGLTRTLKDFAEAAVFVGHRMRVVLREEVAAPSGPAKEFTGTVVSAADSLLILALEGGDEIRIAEESIRRMKLAG